MEVSNVLQESKILLIPLDKRRETQGPGASALSEDGKAFGT
jgi:hypothetical protein